MCDLHVLCYSREMVLVVLNLSALVIVVVEIKFILNWSRDKYGVSRNTLSALEIK